MKKKYAEYIETRITDYEKYDEYNKTMITDKEVRTLRKKNRYVGERK